MKFRSKSREKHTKKENTMFKKVASSEHGKRHSGRDYENYAKMYNKKIDAKGRHAMAIVISDDLCRRAHLRIGQRASIHLVEDDLNKKWLLVERDPQGSKVSSLNTKRGSKKEYERCKVQVRVMDWMERHICTPKDDAREFTNAEAKCTDGAVAFPLEADKDRLWFKRG